MKAVIKNGVWIKTSKDISGWRTIVGPDIIIINDSILELQYLHINKSKSYKIKEGKLVSDSKEDNQQVRVLENGLLELKGPDFIFLFFYVHNHICDLNMEHFIIGKWQLGTQEDLSFVFKNEIDVDSKQKILTYYFQGNKCDGWWSIFYIKNCMILELNMLATFEKKFLIFEEITQEQLKCFYIDLNGINKQLIFSR